MSSSVIRRADYVAPAFRIDTVDLEIRLFDDHAMVRSTLNIRPERPGPVVLDGADLETLSVEAGGVPHRIQGEQLILEVPGTDPVLLTTLVRIDPWGNSRLSGLYRSGDMLCTQCEAEGFRRITWFPDRPDVMARFRVTLEAERARFPVLLSNGDFVDDADCGDGRHRAVWNDPFPKPCYLFAAVAGDLALIEDHFITRSGRGVALRFWVEPRAADQTAHAVASLKKAMAWDEQVFGLEYDLGVYNVVAASHFNMGAMENKSLNIFNSKFVLAKPDTATDGDFKGIESVIAHEYFHNWTGNRVTCRDWFQLTLKEGLTVFRDQEFTADQGSRGLERILDVRALRARQFPEDASPMAHPVRPESYIAIDNFYTATVYEKGAEVIRMIHTLLGPDGFRKGMDLYFARHDGQAVTCDDFVGAMQDASKVDLSQFRRWYEQAGTPRLSAAWSHDPATARFHLTVCQSEPALHIPLRLGLAGANGDVALRLEGENAAQGASRVLDITQAEQTFVFEDVADAPVPSLLRGFSAPVILEAPFDDADLAFLMAHDNDPFRRWEAGQDLASRMILGLTGTPRPEMNERFVAAWGRVLADALKDPAFAAEALLLPSLGVLAEQRPHVDVEALYQAHRFVRRSLASRFQAPLAALFDLLNDPVWTLDGAAMGRRALRNRALALLTGPGDTGRAETHFQTASGMTDRLAALTALVDAGLDAAAPALDWFLNRWRDDPLVIDKWLMVQAGADDPGVLGRVQALLDHPAFDIREPNKVYALIGGFIGNFRWFHAEDGTGYDFLAGRILAIDPANPQLAARLVKPLIRWRRFDEGRAQKMRSALERLSAQGDLSRDTREIVDRALA